MDAAARPARGTHRHTLTRTKPMKTLPALLCLCFTLASALAQAAPAPAGPPPLQGVVQETRGVDAYTYLRLQTAAGEVWAAVPTAAVKVGANVRIEHPMTMQNFESKTLKKHFERIVFGEIAGAGTAAAATTAMPATGTSPHGGMAAPAPAAVAPVKVAKASGPEARTVAEIVAGKAGLKDKTVLVRGQVVKVSSGIMGKNWLHLRDGSGQAADGSNDILVTSQDNAAVGDIVSARGTVRTDVNIGAGYAYAVMVGDAALRKQP